jgi:hypothetical protein
MPLLLKQAEVPPNVKVTSARPLSRQAIVFEMLPEQECSRLGLSDSLNESSNIMEGVARVALIEQPVHQLDDDCVDIHAIRAARRVIHEAVAVS